jgi:hypothetical protein
MGESQTTNYNPSTIKVSGHKLAQGNITKSTSSSGPFGLSFHCCGDMPKEGRFSLDHPSGLARTGMIDVGGLSVDTTNKQAASKQAANDRSKTNGYSINASTRSDVRRVVSLSAAGECERLLESWILRTQA